MPTPNPVELGVVGILLIVLFWVLKYLTTTQLVKKGAVGGPCTDPITRQRVKEVHNYTEGVQTQIAAGDFKCAWHGRDEVRDLLEAQRENTMAMKMLTDELRTTRNGGRRP